jgi:hypothetical protein
MSAASPRASSAGAGWPMTSLAASASFSCASGDVSGARGSQALPARSDRTDQPELTLRHFPSPPLPPHHQKCLPALEKKHYCCRSHRTLVSRPTRPQFPPGRLLCPVLALLAVHLLSLAPLLLLLPARLPQPTRFRFLVRCSRQGASARSCVASLSQTSFLSSARGIVTFISLRHTIFPFQRKPPPPPASHHSPSTPSLPQSPRSTPPTT